MKAQAKVQQEQRAAAATEDAEMVGAENSEMQALAEKHVEKAKKTNTAFYDKVFSMLQNKVVIVGQNDLNEFPMLVSQAGQAINFVNNNI